VARILAELQERVFGRPASWLGYSMGGRIALAAATQGVPMQRLLLESGGPGLATEGERKERRRVDRERAERLRAEGIEAFVDAWLEMPLFRSLSSLPRGDRAAARGVRVSQDASRMAAWLVGAGTGSQPDFRPSLGALDLPVHLLAGSLDAKYVALAREMAESLPRGRVSVVPGAGHAVHLEAPAAWVEWVKTSLGV
jgi:2-succinyl-6-hydroxy-2,4-cyclohexadiene-1-carboxylate synthase